MHKYLIQYILFPPSNTFRDQTVEFCLDLRKNNVQGPRFQASAWWGGLPLTGKSSQPAEIGQLLAINARFFGLIRTLNMIIENISVVSYAK